MKTILDYADLVKEQHALNTTIAPVETDLTSASQAYAVGQKFIHDGALYQAKTAIAQGAALVLNTNYEAADDVSAEIEALTNQVTDISDEVTDMNNVLGAKNLIPFPYSRPSGYSSNGMTCTYDEDGVVTVNKTAGSATAYFALYNDTLSPNVPICLEPNKNYILSLELENATDVSIYVNDGNTDIAFIRHVSTGKHEYSFTTPAVLSSLNVGLYWINTATETNAKAKPMIRLASINDSTYVPYAKTNRQLTAENQTLTNNVDVLIENGAVNKLPNTGTTDTKNGVTATYASDGKVTLNASSASTNISDFPISPTGKPFYLKEGTYVLSGGASADARLYIRTVASASAIAIDSGNGAEFTVTSEMASGGFAVYLNVASGKTFDNVVISPMIADADYTGDYVPYAMTNRELTEKSIIKDVSGYSWDSAIDGSKDVVVKRYGAIVSVYGYFRSTNALAQYANILSGLPHCASGAAKSADMLRNMGMTLQNVDSATSKFVVDSATTANLQYAFNFVYLTDN